jgi:hypothetical protein
MIMHMKIEGGSTLLHVLGIRGRDLNRPHYGHNPQLSKTRLALVRLPSAGGAQPQDLAGTPSVG